MKINIPTAAFMPNTINGIFDHNGYIKKLNNKIQKIQKTLGGDAAEQYLNQEKFKVRYSVAMELLARENALKLKTDRPYELVELVNEYNEYLTKSLGVSKVNKNNNVPLEPDYSILADSPVYPYEADLGISLEQKKVMMQKVVRYLRKKNIFVEFSKTIKDSEANDTKGGYITLSENGERELPIGELVGNRILVNPWNVDFMSCFLTIGHLYGHMVQEMHLFEIAGIREFLAYPKPLNLALVQKNYKARYGRDDYKKDFKIFEEEAFAYAKYSFQEAGIEWSSKIEYAMRVYIETDFDELWRWATQAPEKEAKAFMELFNEYYLKYTGKFKDLYAKNVSIEVVESNSENISVVRDGKI